MLLLFHLCYFFQQSSALLPETNMTRSNTASNVNWSQGGKWEDQQVNYSCIPYHKISYTYITCHSSPTHTGNGQSDKEKSISPDFRPWSVRFASPAAPVIYVNKLTFKVLLWRWSSRQRDSSLLRAKMALLCSLCKWTFSFTTCACFFCSIFICFWTFRLSSSYS